MLSNTPVLFLLLFSSRRRNTRCLSDWSSDVCSSDLPPRTCDRDDLTFAEVVPAIQQEAGANLSFKACHWFSTYRIHHRAAARFRDRRCFLLGDAAHIHSPAGGQGMNTGLQDAYNLGWKLALVVQGRAEPALLDTYEQER